MDHVFNRRILLYFFFIFLILFIYYIYADFGDKFKVKYYALYIEENETLYFTNSRFNINDGDEYKDMKITKAYSGINGLVSSSAEEVPWSKYASNIKKVYVDDTIQPIDTSYWFYNFKNCNYLDLRKIDMSFVTEMSYMFYNTGLNVEEFVIDGLIDWDTSNAIIMKYMFCNTGRDAKVFKIGDFKNWDTEDVSDMSYMFKKAGYNAEWKMDLSNWNVELVTLHDGFNRYVKDKVIEPVWND